MEAAAESREIEEGGEYGEYDRAVIISNQVSTRKRA